MTDLHIGFSRKDESDIKIPLNTLKRHFAALGSSGSGKTVLVKAIMEEAIRAGIPLLLVDLQGDLASLALDGDKKTVESKGVPGSYFDEINSKKQVAIFTPASSKGISISMNPLKAPPEEMEAEDFIQSVDAVADTIASILGYNTDKGKGAEVKAYLFLLLQSLWEKGEEVNSFGNLANYMANETNWLDDSAIAMLKDKDKEKLMREIRTLTIGADSLIFNLGIPLDVEKLMTWQDKGKVPVSVLYLNTLRKAEDRINFIADTATQVYNYMLRNPSDKIQLIFVLDELAGLVPPIRNPPSKKSIQLLLKQARKYGVSLLLATQNISDVDYKSLGQVGTWALGRLMAKQDLAKVSDIIQSISPTEADTIMSNISKQKTGQFMLLAPDVYSAVQSMQVRWLVTDHTTLDDDRVKKIMDESGIRSLFPDAEKKQVGRKKRKKAEAKPVEKDVSEEVDFEEEITAEEEEMVISTFDKETEIKRILDAKPLAVSIDQMSEISGMDRTKVKTTLEKEVKNKKVKKETIEDEPIYWSAKHKMDPKNNIIGPTFRAQLEVSEGEAYKVMDDNVKKILRIKAIETIIDRQTYLGYVPLWKIGTIERKVKGMLKKRVVEIRRFYYVNGMTGGVLNFNEKDDFIEFPFRIRNPEEIVTFKSSDLDLRSISTKQLENTDEKPLLNRKHAMDRVEVGLGMKIDYKTVPALVWYPYFSFTIIDNDKNTTRRAWVDGVYGFYTEENPFVDPDA